MKTRMVRVTEACFKTLTRLGLEQRRTKQAVLEMAVECLAASRGVEPLPRITMDPLHGIPAVIGTDPDFPRTWRSPEEGGYLGIRREGALVPEKSGDRSAPRVLNPPTAIEEMNQVTLQEFGLAQPVKDVTPVSERLKRVQGLVLSVEGGKTASQALETDPFADVEVEATERLAKSFASDGQHYEPGDSFSVRVGPPGAPIPDVAPKELKVELDADQPPPESFNQVRRGRKGGI